MSKRFAEGADSDSSDKRSRVPFSSRRLLNNSFGAVVENLNLEALADPQVSKQLVDLWADAGGLLIVRGLSGLAPHQLCDFSKCFGRLHSGMEVPAEYYIDGVPIMRMGNAKDKEGKLMCYLANRRQIFEHESLQYDLVKQEPNWHTDSVFWERPPLGSLFFCQQAPLEGGETLFADTTAAFASLPAERQDDLRNLEVVCSLAHQWAKKNKSAAHKSLAHKSREELLEARTRSPARRWPLALTHPVTGRLSLYGMNMGTCAVMPKSTVLSSDRMDELELEGIEDDSLRILKDLLVHVSQPQFTVRWKWSAGDLVVWDNRSLFHAGTGFDDAKYTREMWRTTVLTE